MGDAAPFERFRGLSYDAFRELAHDPALSRHERSGFPDSLRAGAEAAILADIESKFPMLASGSGLAVVDIGSGDNPLTDLIEERCRERGHRLTLIDSAEVLATREARDGVRLVSGRFPDVGAFLGEADGSCDVVMAYSVVQYVFAESSLHRFFDAALRLLAPGGRLLLGDVPNASMRRRFLASDTGRRFHRSYTGRDDEPSVEPLLESGEIDDGVVFGLLIRARDAGLHAWLVPQNAGLPMANRREDVLIERP